jgi:hypothetical protein
MKQYKLGKTIWELINETESIYHCNENGLSCMEKCLIDMGAVPIEETQADKDWGDKSKLRFDYQETQDKDGYAVKGGAGAPIKKLQCGCNCGECTCDPDRCYTTICCDECPLIKQKKPIERLKEPCGGPINYKDYIFPMWDKINEIIERLEDAEGYAVKGGR